MTNASLEQMLSGMLSPTDVSVRLGLSKRHVLRLADAGRLKGTVRSPLGRLIPAESVDDYLREREQSRRLVAA
jgi:excisionase family DNA binding protein